MSEEHQTAALESEVKSIDDGGRGGKREACGYLFASFTRGPVSVNPSFYVVAILSLAYLDSRCYDSSNSKFNNMKWFRLCIRLIGVILVKNAL